MQSVKVENESIVGETTKQVVPPSPPPPPSLPRFWIRKPMSQSVTKQEIASFWRQKRINEEDHLLAAIKAAARIRAKNLSEEDYKQFEESLKDDDNDSGEKKENNVLLGNSGEQQQTNTNEVRVGIKDWWTKSSYAYLNQPAIEILDAPKNRTSSFVPNCFTYKLASMYPTSLGVF